MPAGSAVQANARAPVGAAPPASSPRPSAAAAAPADAPRAKPLRDMSEADVQGWLRGVGAPEACRARFAACSINGGMVSILNATSLRGMVGIEDAQTIALVVAAIESRKKSDVVSVCKTGWMQRRAGHWCASSQADRSSIEPARSHDVFCHRDSRARAVGYCWGINS